jgi:hypothetical protein
MAAAGISTGSEGRERQCRSQRRGETNIFSHVFPPLWREAPAALIPTKRTRVDLVSTLRRRHVSLHMWWVKATGCMRPSAAAISAANPTDIHDAFSSD